MSPDNTLRNAEIVRRRAAGEGPREIARQMGLAANTVADVLHRAWLTNEPRGRGYGATDEFERLVLDHASKAGVVKAARAYGVHCTTVYGWLNEAAA